MVRVTTKQQPSTQETLARDPAMDEDHFNRDIPLSWPAEQIDCDLQKEIRADQVVVEETKRQRPKNSQGDGFQPSTTPEDKEVAVDAFMGIPGKKLGE